jgi:hypothetical protein
MPRTRTTAVSADKVSAFDGDFDLSRCTAESDCAAISAWSEACKGGSWIDDEKRRKIRERMQRRKTEGSFEIDGEGVMHSKSYIKPDVKPKQASFHLKRPSLPQSSPASESQDTAPSRTSSSASSGSWLLRKVKNMLKNNRHQAAWRDYNSSSNLDSRTLCLDSSNVDMF